MKYFFKFNRRIIINPAIALFAGAIYLPRILKSHEVWDVLCSIGCLCLLLMILFMYKNVVKLAFQKEPLLEFNEIYIHDHVYNVKYYWADIEWLNGDKDALNIKMYDTDKQLAQFHSLIQKYLSYSRLSQSFNISLGNVNGNVDEMLIQLNDYSIKAL